LIVCCFDSCIFSTTGLGCGCSLGNISSGNWTAEHHDTLNAIIRNLINTEYDLTAQYAQEHLKEEIERGLNNFAVFPDEKKAMLEEMLKLDYGIDIVALAKPGLSV